MKDVMALAIATREMSDWLATNFYNITMPINHRVRIGQEIKALRIAAALSQDKLGEMAGVSQGNVARIETGRYSATIDTLQAVVEPLGYQLSFQPIIDDEVSVGVEVSMPIVEVKS